MELTRRERILLTTEVLNKLTGKLMHDSKIFACRRLNVWYNLRGRINLVGKNKIYLRAY